MGSINARTVAARCYGRTRISERHRHRYEVNEKYVPAFEKKGLIASGRTPRGDLVEVVEVKGHPFYVACQFHPEFKSRPLRPHPLFAGFMKAARDRSRGGSDTGQGSAR